MIRLQPDWVNELAHHWARGDWSQVDHELGYPTVSPMFKRVSGVDSSEDVTGYSSAEVLAMAAAMEYLHLRHYEHWRALARLLRPHLRDTLPGKEGDAALAIEAGRLLEKYIDETLG